MNFDKKKLRLILRLDSIEYLQFNNFSLGKCFGKKTVDEPSNNIMCNHTYEWSISFDG